MKIKKIILLLLLFTLVGCTSEYNLKISDEKFEEKFITNIYPNDTKYLKVEGIEDDDKVSAFINNDQYPIYNNYDIIYDKEVTEKDGYQQVSLKYDYKPEEFKDSHVLNLCFEDVTYKNTDTYFSFNLKGDFYCLYTEQIDINITTDNKVVENNADSVKGNTYTWHISRNDDNNKSIQIKIKKGDTVVAKTSKIIFFVIIFILIISAFIFIHKKKKRNAF